MEKKSNTLAWVLGISLVLVAAAAVTFGILWKKERDKSVEKKNDVSTGRTRPTPAQIVAESGVSTAGQGNVSTARVKAN